MSSRLAPPSSPTGARSRRATRSARWSSSRARPAGRSRFTPEESRSTARGRRGRRCSTRPSRDDTDLCVVLGGDGTILRPARVRGDAACRSSPSTSARSASWRRSSPDGSRRASAARSRASSTCSSCPAIAVTPGGDAGSRSTTSPSTAARAGAWRSSPIGRGRAARRACAATGSSVATPAGSTGYNLANGGPVLAWGVEGYVVSFIAPHTLTARALVVAPRRRARGHNRSREERSTWSVDGRPVCALAPRAGASSARFERRLGAAGAGAGRELLPPPAREVRAAGSSVDGLRQPLRRGALVHSCACCSSCASRTCC